jgi:hypothetical protein
MPATAPAADAAEITLWDELDAEALIRDRVGDELDRLHRRVWLERIGIAVSALTLGALLTALL